jgi:hypothetical protein
MISTAARRRPTSMERANLKDRQKDVYDRLQLDWYTWNETMLSEVAGSYTDNLSGDELADHIGVKKASTAPDIPTPPKTGMTIPK